MTFPGPTLLILAAGMGSRYGGMKQLDGMGSGGEVLMDYSVYDALRAGFQRVVFVIRRDFESEFRERCGRRFERHVAVDYVFQDLELPQDFAVPSRAGKALGDCPCHSGREGSHHRPVCRDQCG